jgi:hypothetical protein
MGKASPAGIPWPAPSLFPRRASRKQLFSAIHQKSCTYVCSQAPRSSRQGAALAAAAALLLVLLTALGLAGVRDSWGNRWLLQGSCKPPGRSKRLEAWGDLRGFNHAILSQSSEAQRLFSQVGRLAPQGIDTGQQCRARPTWVVVVPAFIAATAQLGPATSICASESAGPALRFAVPFVPGTGCLFCV